MNLVPYRIQRQLDDLYDMFSNTFTRNVPSTGDRSDDFWAPFSYWEGNRMMPKVDVEESDQEIIVHAEIPGMDKDEMHLDLSQDRLTIRGEKKYEKEDKGHNYHHRECSYGSFTRTIPLPVKVVDSKAEAQYKNGVLTVHLPKAEEAKKKPIEIKVTS